MKRRRRFDNEALGGPPAAFSAAARFHGRVASGAPAARPRKSRTGFPGIRAGKVLTSAGRYVMHYTASWYDADGKRVGRSFSWRKYGKERALKLAIQVRKTGLEEAERIRRSRRPRTGAASKAPRKSLLRNTKRTAHENVSRVDHNDFHGLEGQEIRAFRGICGESRRRRFSSTPLPPETEENVIIGPFAMPTLETSVPADSLLASVAKSRASVPLPTRHRVPSGRPTQREGIGSTSGTDRSGRVYFMDVVRC